MALKPVTPQQAHALRDDLEADLLDSVSTQMRGWLGDVRAATLRAVESSTPNVLLASSTDEVPPMGTLATWWAARVDGAVMASARAALDRAFSRFTDQVIEASPAESASNTYLASVRDRLVQGTHFGVPVYEDSFDRIRMSLVESAANGWTRQQLAQRIAAELSWEKDGPYWRGQLEWADNQIDGILDPIGPPGNSAREWARLYDPRVQELRDQRNYAIKHLDAERSVWKTRATLIARTEATGGAGFGSWQALSMEGVTEKSWMSALDRRTRLSHAAANEQVAAIDRPFQVGGASLQFPGDPAGPVREVANCRCTMVAGDYAS